MNVELINTTAVQNAENSTHNKSAYMPAEVASNVEEDAYYQFQLTYRNRTGTGNGSTGYSQRYKTLQECMRYLRSDLASLRRRRTVVSWVVKKFTTQQCTVIDWGTLLLPPKGVEEPDTWQYECFHKSGSFKSKMFESPTDCENALAGLIKSKMTSNDVKLTEWKVYRWFQQYEKSDWNEGTFAY